MLQIDLRNAFNTISRRRILEAIHKHCPDLAQWCDYSLRPKAPLFTQGGRVLFSEEGVQQGDPLGPAFFSLAILDICRNVEGARWNVWYLDDGLLVGSKDHLLGILRTLTTQFAEMKLVVNLNKCKLWRPGEVTPQADVSPATWAPWNNDIPVLGTPFGESRSTLDSSVAALGRIWEKLPTLEDCQIAICLLRSCLGCCKVNHLFRTLPLGSHDPFCCSISQGLRETLQVCIGAPVLDSHWNQARLPIKLGGLGLSDPVLVAPLAFLSSIINVCNFPYFEQVIDINTYPSIWELAKQASTLLPRVVEGTTTIPIHNWIQTGHIPLEDKVAAGPWCKQNWWYDPAMRAKRRSLLEASSLRDSYHFGPNFGPA